MPENHCTGNIFIAKRTKSLHGNGVAELEGIQMERPMGTVLYREEQYFAPWVRWGFPIAIGGCAFAVLAEAWLSKKIFSTEVLVTVVGLGVVAYALAHGFRLETEVRANNVRVRLRPFPWVPIRRENVVAIRAVQYRPVLDYGGWGIRIGYKRRAYNARGNLGVRIDYADGSHILIGSQSPQRLAEAIAQTFGMTPILEVPQQP